MNYLDIKKLFPTDTWDMGYMTATQLKICGYSPVKWKSQVLGLDFTNDIHFTGLRNCVVLIKKSSSPGAYEFYQEADRIMTDSPFDKWKLIYTNFKEAALQAGLGVRAKNSLIYSYRFGFESKICVIGFDEKIINVPTNTRINKKLWNRCIDCWDCAINCPAKAIHNTGNKMENNWIDSQACDDFIGMGDHPEIPSVKSFWHKHVHPEIPKKEVDKIKTFTQVRKKYGEYGLPFDKNGYNWNKQHGLSKDGKPLALGFCRECTSQARCSKWKGKYPYSELHKVDVFDFDKGGKK
tara:strand:+ start:261 stop:1142 length:882 start_codon:yes stop_codon:yes gene_type:complete